MKLADLPTPELLRRLRATERAKQPDEYAVSVLQRELERRLEVSQKREAAPCRK